ncbi:MAG: hypothetical protein LC802_24220 [Acidobacteria bacterium]|nr:hypothetical protein [Acidobacteriota bacterium]
MGSQLLWLDNPIALEPGLVGGKAAGLGQLCKLGARVPEGVVIPADAVMCIELEREVDSAIEAIVARAGRATMFAVRSSATVEDGHHASYAGMYKTILDVGPDEVMEAVEECRRSASSARINTYRNVLNRVDEAAAPVAVVIQRMLEPEVSGVCFTINPITGDPDEMIIEAAVGLGERVVGGEVTPDYYCLRLADGALLNFEPGDDSTDGAPLLSHGDRLLLCAEAKTVSESFGLPVDLEFAFAGGGLYLLQARPVTKVARRAVVA